VADLFGNLPARRKFLKSNSAEAARVQELVSRYSLAYPWVRFQLVTDGRPTLSTPGNGKPRETLLALYGAEAASAMLEVQGENPETGSTYPGLRVDGFVSPPNLHRGNRSYMTFFVNRRWVQSRMLAYCVEQAYHGLLPEKRYPLTAVNLTLPYEDVDVNSHPAKREVRFHQEGKVFSTVQRAVRAAVVSESPVPRLVSSSQWSATGSPATGHSSLATSFFAPSPVSSGQWPATGSSATDHSPLATDHQPRPAAPTLKVVGQVKFTYIVAEGPEGMFLVDQHAAHERVLFDRIVLRSASKTPETQPLLQPVTLELTPSQAELLNSNLENLASFGFQVEGFGGATYLLRSVPSAMTTHDPGQSLIDVLDTAAFEGVVRQQEDILAATIACHSAIRAGSPLAEAEMRGLLEQLELADNPHTCPHGRPTMLHISSYQVEREFGRR
jgi:DNA mismatch repair protein MutL